MMDDDSVPLAETEPLLRCAADVAGVHVAGRSGKEAHPHCLSAACLKLSRHAVETIPQPWFGYPKGGCECSWFFGRAYRAGFRPAKVGLIGHRFPVTVLPGPVFKLDREIRRGEM